MKKFRKYKIIINTSSLEKSQRNKKINLDYITLEKLNSNAKKRGD